MKNFNKLFVGLILAFGLMGYASLSQASVVARMPKERFILSYTTTVSSVAVVGSTANVVAQASLPGALYEIILSTGVSGDYLVLYDTGNVTGITAGGPAATRLLPPIAYSTSTINGPMSNQVIVFDPPVIFFNGLVAVNSAATEAASIIFEQGRGLNGQ